MSIDPRAWPGSLPLLLLGALTGFLSPPLAAFAFCLFLGHLCFFRDPRPCLKEGRSVLSPASGKIVEISTVAEGRYLHQEAVKIGIFLSIFDVHVNRAPADGKITYLEYAPGQFKNAMNPESARVNESNWIGMEDGSRRFLVRQVSGAIARRIHCDVRKNEKVKQGQKLGIICYGSRVEIFIPKGSFRPTVELGQRIGVGQTVLGEWG